MLLHLVMRWLSLGNWKLITPFNYCHLYDWQCPEIYIAFINNTQCFGFFHLLWVNRFMFWWPKIGQKSGHLVKRPPPNSLVVTAAGQVFPCESNNDTLRIIHKCYAWNLSKLGISVHYVIFLVHLLFHSITKPDLTLSPIFSWWFQRSRWRACTLASLMNEILWLACSTLSQSLAIWMKKRRAPSKCWRTKSLKGTMCCSLLNSTWLAMFCRILDMSISPRFTSWLGCRSRIPVSHGDTVAETHP